MNDNRDMNHREITDRLRAQLEADAEQVSIPHASPAAARRRAHHRTARRRRMVVGGAMAASVAGMVLGVRQLSGTGTQNLRTVDAPVGTATGPTGSGAAATDPPELQASTVPFRPDSPPVDARPARQGDPAFVWKVVDPGQMNGISTVFSNGGLSTFPGLAISTAPGRSNDYDNIPSRLWHTDDGVSWELTDLQSPFNTANLWSAANVDGRLLAVGTAPGIAATDPNPLQVAITDGTGDAWTTVDLPIDTNALADVPMAVTRIDKRVSALDDGALVAVTPIVDIDFGAIAAANDTDVENFRIVAADSDGVRVLDAGCAGDITAPSSTMAGRDHGDTSDGTVALEPEPDRADQACDTITRSWKDIGVPDATLAAIHAQATQFFHVSVDGAVTPVDSPVPGARLQSENNLDASPVFVTVDPFGNEWSADDGSDTERYRFTGTAWERDDDPVVNWGQTPATLGGSTVGFAFAQRQPFFAMQHPDGTVNYTDPAALFPESSLSPTGGAVAGDHFVAAINQTDDPLAKAGGAEFTRSGVTVRRDSMYGPRRFIDAATGDDIDPSLISMVDNGTVVIRDAAGNERVRFTDSELNDKLEASVPSDAQSVTQWDVITTGDGVTFSVESLPDLLGVDQSAISDVSRVSSNGTQVVLAVTLNDRYPDGTRKQLDIVGTPTG